MIHLRGCAKPAVLANVHHAVRRTPDMVKFFVPEAVQEEEIRELYKCFSLCHLSFGYFVPDPSQNVRAMGDCRWNFTPNRYIRPQNICQLWGA